MTKYLKHYWKKNGNWLTTANEVEQHHPEADYPGLGVTIWMHDSDGVDVCLSEVPDTTGISTITCLLYTSPSPRDPKTSRMPSSA